MTTPITAPVPSSPDAWKKFYDRTYYNEMPFKASKQDTPSMVSIALSYAVLLLT